MIFKKHDFYEYHLQTFFDDISIIDSNIDFFKQFKAECDDEIDKLIC